MSPHPGIVHELRNAKLKSSGLQRSDLCCAVIYSGLRYLLLRTPDVGYAESREQYASSECTSRPPQVQSGRDRIRFLF